MLLPPLVALLGLGCASVARGGLPAAVVVVVAREDGAMVSLLIDLERNERRELDVRVADGARVFDGGEVWSFEDGAIRGLVSGRAFGAPNGSLARVDAHAGWFVAADEVVRCPITGAACAPAPLTALADTHAGPSAGFRVHLRDGVVSLQLPADPTPEDATPLTAGVARILGVVWVPGHAPKAIPQVDRTFRGRAPVRAIAGPVTVDGSLDEWAGAEPAVISAPWHLERGGAAWGDARDASWSVAARVTPEGQVCFAGRVRDDARDDADALAFTLGDDAWSLPLVAGATPSAAVAREPYGARYELCRPAGDLAAGRTPFRAVLHDVDPDGVTELASAPLVRGEPGALFWAPPGRAR